MTPPAATSTSPGSDAAGLSSAQVELLLNVCRSLAVTVDLDALLREIAESTCRLLGCERSSIWLHDATKGELWTKVALGSDTIRLPVGQGIVGAAFGSNRVVHSPQPYDDPRFSPDHDRRSGFVTRSLLAAPMVDFGGQPVGVIEAVNKIQVPFSPQDESLLRLLAAQAGVAIQRHRLQVAAQKAAELRREMDLARKAQLALLPKTTPTLTGFDIAAWAEPASITGGDCYDLWHLPDGRLGVFVADASGHGLAPTLVVSMARTLVRALCDREIASEPHTILQHVNDRLMKDLERTRFVTAFLAFVSPQGEVRWQSAGQGPIFIRRSGTAPLERIDPPVPPMNVLREFGDEAPSPMTIEPGGALALVSDGVIEAFNPAREILGEERVIDQLERSRAQPAEQCITAIQSSVSAWQQGQERADDQTIVMLKRI
jgi:serine phosphatase RsbU (regulator of sigma subunit)